MTSGEYVPQRGLSAFNASSRPSILVGFDFYGSGNMGDDLMFAGFLNALDELGYRNRLDITATSAQDIESQRKRFPDIEWISRRESDHSALFGHKRFDCWAGVGGTAFQMTCGRWMLDFLIKEMEDINGSLPCILINVGAETEVGAEAAEFANIASKFSRISTRDEHSSRFLFDRLGVSPERVFLAADLANLSLMRLSQGPPVPRIHRLGMIVAADTMCWSDVQEVRQFLLRRPGFSAWVAGDTSEYHERRHYARLAPRPWSPLRFKSKLVVPDYARASLAELVHPIASCETLISSRYHGLLAGAWMGCRVAAIARSSKVETLARQLDVPFTGLPVTRAELVRLERDAVVVPRHKLIPNCELAVQGVAFALGDAL